MIQGPRLHPQWLGGARETVREGARVLFEVIEEELALVAGLTALLVDVLVVALEGAIGDRHCATLSASLTHIGSPRRCFRLNIPPWPKSIA